MIDEELDYWSMSAWADVAQADKFADELSEATSMDDDEIVACLAWLQEETHTFPDGQYTGEAIEALFEEHTVGTYSSWAAFAERWIDSHGGETALTALTNTARAMGNQDVFFEILARLGEDIADTEGNRFWWFHVATLLDGRVFCVERPVTAPPGA